MKTYRLQRSFCKSLFSGRVNQETIFPYPKMDATEGEVVRILLESLSRFAKEKIRSATIDNEGVLPQDVIKGLAKLGVLGMSVPQEYGGAGFSNSAYNRVFEEICKVYASEASWRAADHAMQMQAVLGIVKSFPMNDCCEMHGLIVLLKAQMKYSAHSLLCPGCRNKVSI